MKSKSKTRSRSKWIMLSFLLGALSFLLYYSFNTPFLSGEVIRNVEYKSNLYLDLYHPSHTNDEKHPVLVYFHGGAWVVGSKLMLNVKRIDLVIHKLRDQGYAIVSPQYTLARKNKTPFPSCLEDAEDVMIWIKDNAEKYHFDLNNVGLIGESAGAHIAMMTAMAPDSLLKKKQADVNIKYVVDLYGPNNLNDLYFESSITQIERLGKRLFGFYPKEYPDKATALMYQYSPATYISSDDPAMLIIHGEDDQIVPISQSINFQKQLDSIGIQNEFKSIPNVGHGFVKASKKEKIQIQNDIIDFITSRNLENQF